MNIRKAGELMKANPIPTALVGGSSILGIAGVLQALSPNEREVLIEDAIMAEEQGGGTALGVSSGALMSAAALAYMTTPQADDSLSGMPDFRSVDDIEMELQNLQHQATDVDRVFEDSLANRRTRKRPSARM